MNEEKLIALLREKQWHICCAESCTGGLLNATLVNVPGASDVLEMGFVTYANRAKQQLMGVREESLSAFGAVSEQVAAEMAAGAARVSGAEIGVGISGIAGPGGAEHKPEGMVCFGFCVNGAVTTATCQFGTIGRNNVRRRSCDYAVDALLKLLDK